MQTEITHTQRKRFFYLCKVLNRTEQQMKDHVMLYSDGETDSVATGTKLTFLQMDQLLAFLQSEVRSQKKDEKPYQETDSHKLNRMRRKMLSLGYNLGMGTVLPWNKGNAALKAKKPSTVNTFQVDQWCRGKRCANPKGLNDYTVAELAKVISQFEKVTKKELARWEL